MWFNTFSIKQKSEKGQSNGQQLMEPADFTIQYKGESISWEWG